MNLVISPFDPTRCSEPELRAWYDAVISAARHDSPDAPLPDFEAYADSIRRPRSATGTRELWSAAEGTRIVGTLVISYPEAENGHLAVVAIHVRPELRRQGIGTDLLRRALPQAEKQGRSVVFGSGLEVGSPGQLWAASLRFRNVQECLWQILRVDDVDAATWEVAIPAGFRLERWVGAAPEALVEVYAHARRAIEDAPAGDSTMANPQWTAERVRQSEREGRAAGEERRVIIAVHEESGAVAAITEIAWRSGRPDYFAQRDTAVVPAFRGRGLGFCVKAAMMRWLLADHPEVKQGMTNNAADNAYMIRVNKQLGYVTYSQVTSVEADTNTLSAEL